MARADLLLDLVRAASRHDGALWRKALEAVVAEERAKQHHVFADRLALFLRENGASSGVTPPPPGQVLSSVGDLVVERAPTRRLSELVLPDHVMTTVMRVIEENHRGDLLRSYNLEPRNRLLLVGPPGNGKTSLAEALAAELSSPLLVVRYESVIGSYLGETAARLSRLFENVRTRRCVLFFDEFDVVGKERGDPHETGEIKRVVSSLLVQIDALPSHVMVVSATNHPELLDNAAWRRFQVRLVLPKPTRAQAVDYLSRLRERINGNIRQSPATLAKALGAASFAELEEFVSEVQRRYVLALPDADASAIVKQCLHERQMQLRAR